MSAPANTMSLSGVLGPDRIDAIERAIGKLLDAPRPQLEVRLVNVESIHLGVVNLLVKAQRSARQRHGDISVFVDAHSDAQRLLRAVGIVGTMRP